MAKPAAAAQKSASIPELIQTSIKSRLKGGALFKKSSAALNQALALGAKAGDPITLPDGKMVTLVDQFEKKNEVFLPKSFARYAVEDYTPPANEKK
jgi:hypothetical protein